MSDLLIRNVPAKTLAALRTRAKSNGSSVQSEALAALEAGTRNSGDTLIDDVRKLRAEGKLSFDLRAALEALRTDRAR